MNAQELRTKVANRAAKGGSSSDVVYVHDNVPYPLGNEKVRLYALQTERDGVKASFMIEGERAMRICTTEISEEKVYPAKYGGLEYRYCPLIQEALDIVEKIFG